MIALGLVMLVLGALLEARVHVLGAWPSAVPWVLMGGGLLLIVAGRLRARKLGR